jgi:hypothetical protein
VSFVGAGFETRPNNGAKMRMQGYCCGLIIFFLTLNQIAYGAEAWMTEWERAIKAAEFGR